MVSAGKILSGNNVLIVGGSGKGIGGAILEGVVNAGAEAVGIVGSDRERTETAASVIGDQVQRSVGLVADISVPGVADSVVNEAVERLGGLDVLITVVGGSSAFVPFTAIHATPDQSWSRIFEMNLGYVFRTVRACLPHFINQGRGAVVSVGSISGSRASPLSAAYGAAKAGLMSLAKTVCSEYGATGVRMNVVNAGIVSTPALAAAIDDADDFVITIPVARYGASKEVADAVVFLASPQSSFINGQTLDVDGGTLVESPWQIVRRLREGDPTRQ